MVTESFTADYVHIGASAVHLRKPLESMAEPQDEARVALAVR